MNKNVKNGRWSDPEYRKAYARKYRKKYFSDPKNVEKRKAHGLKYANKNREKRRAYGREYVNRPEIKEKKATYQKEWAEEYYAKPENKQKVADYLNREDVKVARAKHAKEYHAKKENKDRRKVVRAAYYSEEENVINRRSTENQWYYDNKMHVLSTMKGKDLVCRNCGFDIFCALELHHIVPISDGGTEDVDNKMTLCANCHKQVHEILRTSYSRTSSTTI